MRRPVLALAALLFIPAADFAAAADPPDYSLTVYSAVVPGQLSATDLASYAEPPGFALVRDSRRMQLGSGISELKFTDVAKLIDPTSVGFASLTDPEGTRVLEQNFQFDLVSQQKLMDRYIGSRISVDQVLGDKVETLTGKLLSADGGLVLEKDSGEIVTLAGYGGNVRYPSLPGGLITKPTLVWMLDAKKGGIHDTRVSYQTRGMAWWADYNVTLREEGGKCDMDLAAWVTLINKSGASYPNSQLRLVAGEVNRAPAAPVQYRLARMKAAAMMDEDRADGFQESSLSEYHLYTLGRRTDLPDNSAKQLELFPSLKSVPCRKELVFSAEPGPMQFYGSPISDQGYAASFKGKTGAYVEFDNKETAGMGMPLPAGRVRVNQAAADGSLEFVGEDRIDHTPCSETVRVKLGNSFDVVGDRKQTSFRYDDSNDFIEESFEVSVRNRKKEAVHVVAREYLYRWSDWRITANTAGYRKRDAQTVDFPLDIPADGEAKFTYTVRYTW